MYYIVTLKNDCYHKYVASMTGAAVKDQEIDDGVYMFEDEKACDRAVGTINKLYGSGIFIIAEKRELGNQVQKSSQDTVQKEGKPMPARGVKVQSVASKQNEIVRNLLQKPNGVPSQPLTNAKAERQIDSVIDMVKDTLRHAEPKALSNRTKGAKTVSSDSAGENDINIDEVENIGNEQYALDEGIENFDVAAAIPVMPRRR